MVKSFPRFWATSIVFVFPAMKMVSCPLSPFCGCDRDNFAPVLPPFATRPICCSGALVKEKMDSSRSTSELELLFPIAFDSPLGDTSAWPRFSSMLASPIPKAPCCGSSASSQLSNRCPIIAVVSAKCTAGAPPSGRGRGFNLPSIASA